MKYLFCYFVGNQPEEETVHFAVSDDGFNFEALNNNEPVIKQKLGKKCCRDPFIFRDENNVFHIIATDMRSNDGWNSNNSMVVWDSDDLINWKNERIIDFSKFESTKNADIIEKDGKYYLYQADGEKEAICYAVSDNADGPYFEPDDNKVSVATVALEGNCIYKIDGTDKYVMIADQFRNGGYFMQETTDMIHFRKVKESNFSLNHLNPRHGSMLYISDEEYENLISVYK